MDHRDGRRSPAAPADHRSDPRDRVRRAAAGAHGLISRRYAVGDLGISPKVFEGWQRNGSLEAVRYNGQVLRGVHRIAGCPQTAEQLALACALRCGPGSRLVGAVPLALLGVEGFTSKDEPVVLVPYGRRFASLPFRVRRDGAPDEHHATVAGIASATVTRNLVEAAVELDDRSARVAFDSARWMSATDPERLRFTLAQMPSRHPGVRRLTRLRDAGAFVQESEGERQLAPALQELGERVRWGVWVTADIRVDALLEDLRIVVEYDGREEHERALRQASDEARAARLRHLGYEVVRIRREDLRRPAAVQRLLVEAVVLQRVRLAV